MKIRYSHRKLIASSIVLLLMASAGSAQAARFFRYVDENQQLVLSHTIPNDKVKLGYEIVDENGSLIQKVAPQLSEHDYQAKLAQEAADKECMRTLDRVRNLYQFSSDIDDRETKAVESIETRINNTNANLSNVLKQKAELESQAARMDISGQQISRALLDNIQRAQSQENNLRAEIRLREDEKSGLHGQYDYERAVFDLENCSQGLPKTEQFAKAAGD